MKKSNIVKKPRKSFAKKAVMKDDQVIWADRVLLAEHDSTEHDRQVASRDCIAWDHADRLYNMSPVLRAAELTDIAKQDGPEMKDLVLNRLRKRDEPAIELSADKQADLTLDECCRTHDEREQEKISDWYIANAATFKQAVQRFTSDFGVIIEIDKEVGTALTKCATGSGIPAKHYITMRDHDGNLHVKFTSAEANVIGTALLRAAELTKDLQ